MWESTHADYDRYQSLRAGEYTSLRGFKYRTKQAETCDYDARKCDGPR